MSKETNEDARLAHLEAMENQQENSAPLGKVIIDNSSREEVQKSINIKIGFFEIDKTQMPYGAKFYPSNWKFQVRALTPEEIIQFSTIDTTSVISTTNMMNYIMERAVRIIDGNKQLSWKNLNEFDRIWFVMHIRHITLPQPEQSLVYTAPCECGEINTIKLDFDNLVYEEETETSKKYWNQGKRVWEIATKTFGSFDMEPITLYKAIAYKDYTLDQAKQNIKIDIGFAKIYWMLLTSQEAANGGMKAAHDKYKKLSMENAQLIGFYIKLSNELNLQATQQIKFICEKETCGKEVYTGIQFPGGLENLFFSANLDTELL